MKPFLTIVSLLLFVLFSFISCGTDDVSRASDTYLDVSGEESTYSVNENATVYEDAEDGLVMPWETWQGHEIKNADLGANGSSRSIFVRENWLRNQDGSLVTDNSGFPINGAHYELPINNDYQFVLEFDKMKRARKDNFCFTVGVKVQTTAGQRYISFNPFYDKEGIAANGQWLGDEGVKELTFPLDMSYVEDTGVWKHLRFDLNNYLHQLEPNNQITKVNAFYFQGGDDYLDNIRLVSE